jgi:hypothetical protein
VQHSANALALARCLTRVAELSSFATPPLQALWALGHRSHLSQRVERLVSGERTQDVWHTRVRSRILTLVALGIAAIFVCAAPRTTVFAERDEPPAEKLDPSDISPLPLRRGMFQAKGRLSREPHIPGEAEHEVRSALSQATTFDCDKLPLRDFLDRIFKNSTLKLDGTFLKGHVDTSLPVTVHVHGTPLLSALDSGFGQLNLDYGFEVHTDQNGTRSRRLIITHAEPDPMVLRSYGIGSADDSEFKSLETRIKSKIEPESWGEAKGQAQIASDEKHRRMIVRQTPRAHDQIKSMLGNLGKLSPLYITVRTAVVSEDLLRRAGIERQTARGPGHTVINLSEAQYKDLVIDAVETDEWAFSLRPRVCVTVGHEASIAPYSESPSVWPQTIRVRTALVDGRPSISFEMTGIDPITAQSLTESATNPEFKPLLIEMRQKSWRETMRHTISKTKPTSNGTLIEVNRVSSKNSPAPRRFILVKPELGPMTATVRSVGR